MRRRWMLIVNGLFMASGCMYHVQERVDQVSCELASHPFDVAPETPGLKPVSQAKAADSGAAKTQALATQAYDVQTTAYLQQEPTIRPFEVPKGADRLKIPVEIPGAETPAVVLSRDAATQLAQIKQLFPELPAMPNEPRPLPGPDGHPYTLSSFQQLAAQFNPNLKQAVSDVEAARGNLIQAQTYKNPTIGYEADPSNDGSTAAVQGVFVDQNISTVGKMKLQAAAAQKDVDNAELALRKARSDLATQVRQQYYAFLIAKETVRVNLAVAKFTEDIYLLQKDILRGGIVAAYEPAALRALAYTARLTYKQSISTYLYQWKQLSATVGIRQIPLSEVSGRVDGAIPFYDYDTVLSHVLHSHTDLLTARNAIEKSKYNLKFAQVTPVPDVDVRFAVLKEYALPPQQWTSSVQVGMQIPVWDHNKGNIIAQEAALMRASEEPHRVEMNITSNLTNAYTAYKNNLDALEYYRGYILPDQVRAFRGIWIRRDGDPNVAFADIVTAQQTLVTSVQSYLTILSQLWTSVVNVADVMQTDDLFQLAQPRMAVPLPEFENLPPLSCNHACATACGTPAVGTPITAASLKPVASGSSVAMNVAPSARQEPPLAAGDPVRIQPAAGSLIVEPMPISPTAPPAATTLPPAFAPGFGMPRMGFVSPPGS